MIVLLCSWLHTEASSSNDTFAANQAMLGFNRLHKSTQPAVESAKCPADLFQMQADSNSSMRTADN